MYCNTNLNLTIDNNMTFNEWSEITSPRLLRENESSTIYGDFSVDTNEYFEFNEIYDIKNLNAEDISFLPIDGYNHLIVNYNYIINDCECMLSEIDNIEDIDFELQSFEWVQECTLNIKVLFSSLGSSMDEIRRSLGEENFDFWMKLLEDVTLTIYNMVNAKSVSDISLAYFTFIKLRSGKPLITQQHLQYVQDIINEIFYEVVPQTMEENLKSAREILNKYEELKNAPIFKKIYKIIMYILSFSIFDKFGISFDKLRYSKLEQEAIRKQYYSKADFSIVLLDTIVFICERGSQCMITGTLDPIYHSGSKYEDWYRTVSRLKRESQFLSNPEPHGICKFKFLAELDDTIDKGNAIYKHVSRIGEMEKTLVRTMLSDLELIRANELTKKAACKERKAPFSILLYGGSSVAKSTLTKLLFYQYGKIFNLPIESEYKYTRIFSDEYWSGFKTNMWCGQVDDIAPLNPNAAQGVDETLLEVIRIQNSVPYVPPQADLVDKGKTPVQFRFFIATTNTEHLNAHAYFACPLAVQRRFPFVIEVKPKPEYIRDGTMLDGNKVPEIQEGEYPDYWVFKVKRVIPHGNSIVKQTAKLEIVNEFDNIYNFIKWFSIEAKKYEELATKTINCDDKMSKVTLCEGCYLPKERCECNVQTSSMCNYTNSVGQTFMDFNEQDSFLITIYGSILSALWWAIFHLPLMNLIVFYTIGYKRMVIIFGKYLYDERVMYFLYRRLGDKVHSKICKYKPIINLVGLLAFGALIYKVMAKIVSYSLKGDSQMFYDVNIKYSHMIPHKDVSTDTDDLNEPETCEQISNLRGRCPTVDKDKKDNVWYNDNFELSTFDVSSMITSYKGLDFSLVQNLILRNCVHFRFKYDRIEGELYKILSMPNRAFCIAGHLYMCNNHAVPTNDTFKLCVVDGFVKEGINPSLEILINQKQIHRFPERDLAFIVLRNLPPKKDLTELFPKESFKGIFKGIYLGRTETGGDYKKEVHNISFKEKFYNKHLDTENDSWLGFVNEPTSVGDCGSILLAQTGYGPVLLGIHYLGSPFGSVMSIVVTQEFLQDLIASLKLVIVQSGNPKISAPTAPRALGSLHKKSPVRYINEGSAHVYGSFEGFRPRLKSNVGPTFIREAMVKRGYPINYGAPVMGTWEPWNLALNDMVKPVCDMDASLLDVVKKDFINDILSNLSKDDLSTVHVYDDITALNGAAGVAYVDKINRNTSAGCPWRKGKKHFLKSIPPIQGLQDPVEADSEIMDRVSECITNYENGYRYMPVFCGHLKDEPTKFEKIDKCKTRVFTGAPFDWSLVVRKYLLSVIRLIQNKRYVFECAAGTIAQSIEWQEIRDYLTKFGDDRIVGGDFGKFDKRMASMVILAAFDVIVAVCEAAGYSQDELKVVHGIAADVAFPVVDFNGDFIQFFGSNPSGHPLTVIINSLANSLYMRYCYASVSGLGHAKDFKDKVALLTYGDDNDMGISGDIPWFNHCSISKCLASIGIEYTMPDKTSESVPYTHIDQASFLKRTWRYDEDVGAYLAPLEHDSIEKMLTTCVRSKTISPEAQAVAVISTALREYFFYGKRVFEKRRDMFKDIVKECDLELYVQESTFPMWQDLYDQFWIASGRV